MSFLDFGEHSHAILELLGHDPGLYRLVCVDLDHGDHGAVLGNGDTVLHIGHEHGNHFVSIQMTLARRSLKLLHGWLRAVC